MSWRRGRRRRMIHEEMLMMLSLNSLNSRRRRLRVLERWEVSGVCRHVRMWIRRRSRRGS